MSTKNKSKINILFIEFCPIGGSSTGLLTEIDFINKSYSNRFSCVVIGLKNSIFENIYNRFGFTFYSIEATELTDLIYHPFQTLKTYFKALLFILKICRQHEINIIHCNHYMWSIYANPAGFILNIPVIIHLKDVWMLKPKIARILMKFNPKSKYIAVSNYVKKLFIDYFKISQNKITMIYDGINNDIFYRLDKIKIQKKSNDQNKIFLMMSRISEDRDIEIYIDLAALFIMKYPNSSFYHYGYNKYYSNKNYFKKLQYRVKALNIQGNFHFKHYLDHPEKVASVLRKAYLTIIPARQFALPNTAIESMMCGTPVIAFQTGGNSEIISNEKMGTLINTNSPIIYLEKIEEFLIGKKNYQEAAILGSRFVHQKFSAAKQYQKIIHLYFKTYGV